MTELSGKWARGAVWQGQGKSRGNQVKKEKGKKKATQFPFINDQTNQTQQESQPVGRHPAETALEIASTIAMWGEAAEARSKGKIRTGPQNDKDQQDQKRQENHTRTFSVIGSDKV